LTVLTPTRVLPPLNAEGEAAIHIHRVRAVAGAATFLKAYFSHILIRDLMEASHCKK
jgi:hypothetical protein